METRYVNVPEYCWRQIAVLAEELQRSGLHLARRVEHLAAHVKGEEAVGDEGEAWLDLDAEVSKVSRDGRRLWMAVEESKGALKAMAAESK